MHNRTVIIPIKETPEGFSEAGYGRIIRFQTPQKLHALIKRISDGLGVIAVSVATPQAVSRNERLNVDISSVGICAGSGGSMLNGLDVDLLFTGELSHHEALTAIEQGKCVVTVFHSNSERAFLKQRMRGLLRGQIEKELSEMTKQNPRDQDLRGDFNIHISDIDRDPFDVVTRAEIA